jgi:hypothetical protein
MRCGQFEVTSMVSILLSIGFGIGGFSMFFLGFGSSFDIALGVGVITAVGMWTGDRLTTKREATLRDTIARATPTDNPQRSGAPNRTIRSSETAQDNVRALRAV